ncbi:protein FAM107B [Scomber japonicus]|uniref:protein FAM107B n=1 Tax=Scomber japonicus TaxID=13676 RepID=UPI002305376E|nr:protein FAM107B [Scomber japonicus]
MANNNSVEAPKLKYVLLLSAAEAAERLSYHLQSEQRPNQTGSNKITVNSPVFSSFTFSNSKYSQKPGYGHHRKETSVGHSPLSHQSPADCSGEDIIPRKLNGSSMEMPSHQNLHRELLLSHKRGLLPEEKPELKRVLEQRRLELHKEEEMAQRQPSDLEMELRKRQQKLEEYEQEEIRRRENQQKIPEFVRVRDNLRRTQTFEH